MKVLHVITGLNTGGAELMLARLLEHTDRSQFGSSVVSLTDIGPTGRAIAERGISVTALGMARGVPDPRALWSLTRILRRERPDVVQTWLYHADLLGGVAAKLAGGIPVAWGVHLGNLAPELNKPSTLLTAKGCARISRWAPRAIVCCAAAARDSHVAFGYRPERMVVIPNGFDLDRFQPDLVARSEFRRELGVDDVVPLVGLVARFDPQKDHETFVRAAGIVAKSRPETRFVMCGSDITPDNRQLVAWIDAAGIRDRCFLLGRRDDMARVQAALDICCSSSRGEAFPLAVGESMATGVPCVVTDVGDSAVLVGETGRVVPPGDAAALAAAVVDMIEMGAEGRAASGRGARRRISERFSLARSVAGYGALYERLAAGEAGEPVLEGAR